MTMDYKTMFLSDLGKAFVPQIWRPHLREYFLKAGVMSVNYDLFGWMFHLSTFFTIMIYGRYVFPRLMDPPSSILIVFISSFPIWVILQGLVIGLFILITYTYLDIKIYQRTKEMEGVLDQYLSLVSENLKGGQSLENSLWAANRSDFGILSREIHLISKRVATGEDVAFTFKELTLRYNSPMLRRSFNLLVEAIEAGGNITELLDRIVSNLKDTKLLKQEMVATNTSYIIFIAAVSLVVSPLLFALGSQLLEIFSSFSTQISGSLQNSMMETPFTGMSGPPPISPKQYLGFARSAVITIALCASMITSMVSRGDIRGGVKFVPIYATIALLVFTAMTKVLATIFGGLF